MEFSPKLFILNNTWKRLNIEDFTAGLSSGNPWHTLRNPLHTLRRPPKGSHKIFCEDPLNTLQVPSKNAVGSLRKAAGYSTNELRVPYKHTADTPKTPCAF